jgi:gas vesicle protein
MADHKSSKFGMGVVIGTILGGVAALFLSPTSGKENREMVVAKFKELQKMIEEAKIEETLREIYGEVTEEGEKMYKVARKEILKRMDELKDRVDEIDKEKYMAIVEDAMEKVQNEVETKADKIAELKKYFMSGWNEGAPKKTAKK